MGKFLSYFTALFRRVPRGSRAGARGPIYADASALAAGGPAASVDSSVEAGPPVDPAAALRRLLAGKRERLFVSAVQLLDDPQAAKQVVAETLSTYQTLHGPTGGASTAGEPPDLERALDRLLLGLVLVRLKALPPPPRSGATRESWPSLDAGASSEAGVDDAESDETSSGGGQLERTARALSLLPVEPRVAVMLVVMQARPLAEAAALLGATEEACRFYLSHGRKLLRRALQRDLLTDEDADRPSGLVVQPEGRTLHDLRRNKKAIARA